jgi:DNA-binding winged helix-turn-helix (wHTH) protein/TolB-like protein/tetratricopeptide (TPR) repeat protein
MQQQCKSAYKFGPFLLDPPAHLLLKDGSPIALPPKAFETLLMLVQYQGTLLTKNDLLNAVWPDAYVEENNLTQYVSMLRKVLGDDGNGNKYIETVPRLGYRFVAGVREVAEEEESVLNGSETTRLENRIETANPLPIQSPSARLTRPRLAGASLALIVLGLATIYWVSKPANPVSANVRTLAVLPLRNLKPDPETDFLSMALADAIINRLGYVSQLVVQPSSTIGKYRNVDTDARQIARELNVQTVLAGSYVKEGDEMRVTTELISVDGSGSPARDSIELKYDKLLTVQDRVAASVIHSMGLALQPQEVDRLKRGLPTNPEAYEYYLRGRERSLQSDFQGAEKLMESSVSLEPGNARAWADLANNSLGYARVQGGGQFYADKGWEAFQRAVALDPDNPLIVDLMAFQMIENNKVDEAVSVLRKSLQHNANDSWAHWHLSEAYRYGGALNESVKEGELARALNPVVGENLLLNTYLYVGQYEKFLGSLPASEDNARTSFYRGIAYCYLKRTSRAVAEFNHAFALDPSLLHSQIGEALASALTGRQPQGLEIMRKIEGINTQDGEMIYKMAQAYAQLGDSKSSLRLLRRSIELNFYPYPYFRQDPLLEPLHKEAEYSGLIELARQRHEAFLQRFF